jgi:hypothetical protein
MQQHVKTFHVPTLNDVNFATMTYRRLVKTYEVWRIKEYVWQPTAGLYCWNEEKVAT